MSYYDQLWLPSLSLLYCPLRKFPPISQTLSHMLCPGCLVFRILQAVNPPTLQGEAASQPCADIGPFMQACFSGAVANRPSCIAQVDCKVGSLSTCRHVPTLHVM